MDPRRIVLVGAPVDSGKTRKGCLMGPDAYRTARVQEALEDLGHTVLDAGNVAPRNIDADDLPDLHMRRTTIGWTHSLSDAAEKAMEQGTAVFMGGDHALSLGSVRGVTQYAASQNRPQFVLWLDAHSDFHTPRTTSSGNLHGTPLAYLTGQDGFDGFPEMHSPIAEENTCILGLRSVDAAERAMLSETKITRHDMRDIDEHGIARLLQPFLDKVSKAGGALHVSLDVDFLDPSVAPAVGTTVPGGATIREAHLVMEMLCDSNLMTSLDLVELNPMLDERGRTAQVMVDLTASAFGRRVFDRPTPRLL